MSAKIIGELLGCLAKLDNGDIVFYDMAADRKDAYRGLNVEYIGQGVYYKIDGVLQGGHKVVHFFRLVDDGKQGLPIRQ